MCGHKPLQLLLNFELDEGSRYIYELFYDKDAISKQLYDWLLKNGYADGNLIAKWKKQGYEKVRHRKLSETHGIRTNSPLALLSSMCTNERDQLQFNLHLSSSQSATEGESNHRVR